MSKPIFARHFRTGKPLEIAWTGAILDRFRQVNPAKCGNRWVAPPLIDLQVNGFAGVDFQTDSLKPADFIEATRSLQQHGCAHFFPTLITDRWRSMTRRLETMRSWRSQKPILQAAIAGWHIEGPFLSAVRGFHGAHNPALMMDPRPAHLTDLRRITGNDSLLLTLAPERKGALSAISQAASLGFVISLGHTDAPQNLLIEAIRKGATAFTHLGNACPQEMDRHDNILWRVLDISGLSVSLIPDQIHLSPLLFRLVHRLIPASQLFYVTDAMSAAGAGPGRYALGQTLFDVGEDGIVREPGRKNFAGSSLTPIEGVLRAAKMRGCSWQKAWTHFSDVPRRLMKLPPALRRGQPASFCLIEETTAGSLICTPYISGEKFPEREITVGQP